MAPEPLGARVVRISKLRSAEMQLEFFCVLVGRHVGETRRSIGGAYRLEVLRLHRDSDRRTRAERIDVPETRAIRCIHPL